MGINLNLQANLTAKDIEEAVKQYVRTQTSMEVKSVTFKLTQHYDQMDRPSGAYVLQGAEVHLAPPYRDPGPYGR